jgi:hypothetical protein
VNPEGIRKLLLIVVVLALHINWEEKNKDRSSEEKEWVVQEQIITPAD